MSLHHNPRIVTSGLVLALDAGDVNSYPGSGTTWYDLSGNGHHGTLNGAPTFETDGIGSFFFDQSNDTVSIGKNGAELGIADTAISGELVIRKETGYPSNNLQGHMGFGGSSQGPNIKNTNPAYFLDTYNASNSRVTCDFHSTSFASSYAYTWLILTFTFSGETVKTYTNGEYYASYTLTGGMRTFQDKNFSIATGYGYYRTYGNIASTKLYSRELTATEVLQNYNAQKSRFGL